MVSTAVTQQATILSCIFLLCGSDAGTRSNIVNCFRAGSALLKTLFPLLVKERKEREKRSEEIKGRKILNESKRMKK